MNRFGRMCAIPLLMWSTAGLIAAAFRAWPMAEALDIASWVALIAQAQWGRL